MITRSFVLLAFLFFVSLSTHFVSVSALSPVSGLSCVGCVDSESTAGCPNPSVCGFAPLSCVGCMSGMAMPNCPRPDWCASIGVNYCGQTFGSSETDCMAGMSMPMCYDPAPCGYSPIACSGCVDGKSTAGCPDPTQCGDPDLTQSTLVVPINSPSLLSCSGCMDGIPSPTCPLPSLCGYVPYLCISCTNVSTPLCPYPDACTQNGINYCGTSYRSSASGCVDAMGSSGCYDPSPCGFEPIPCTGCVPGVSTAGCPDPTQCTNTLSDPCYNCTDGNANEGSCTSDEIGMCAAVSLLCNNCMAGMSMPGCPNPSQCAVQMGEDNDTLTWMLILFFLGLLLAIIVPTYVYSLTLEPRDSSSPAVSSFFSSSSSSSLLSSRSFWSLYSLTQLLIVNIPRFVCIALLVVAFQWIMLAEGGLGFNATSVFGWHALMMILAGPVLLTEAIGLFSYPAARDLGAATVQSPNTEAPVDLGVPQAAIWGLRNKKIIRISHIMIHLCSALCAILGLVAIAYYKALSQSSVFPYYTLYTPHSWLGIVCICLWVLQFGSKMIHGFMGKIPSAVYRQTHFRIGYLIWGTSLATCALGFQDMQSSDLAGNGYPYNSNLSFLSGAGVLCLIFLALSQTLVPVASASLAQLCGVNVNESGNRNANANASATNSKLQSNNLETGGVVLVQHQSRPGDSSAEPDNGVVIIHENSSRSR